MLLFLGLSAALPFLIPLEARAQRGADPRRTAVFPDTTFLKVAPMLPVHAAPAPTGPRTVRLQTRTAVVSPNIQMHPSSTVHQSELSIATHPANPEFVLAGANAVDRFLRVASQGWYHTADGGASWQGSDTLPSHIDFTKYMADPAVTINLAGHLFLNALLIRDPTYEVVIARSMDQGAHWSQVSVPSRTEGEDKNHMAIDVNPGSPFSGYIYTAYTDFDYPSSPILFSRSTQGGIKFSVPRAISGSVGSYFAQGANLAVGPNGELYAAWSGYDNFPPVTTHLGFNKSTDGGATWQGAFSIRDVFDIRGMLQKGENSVRVNSFPSMAVDGGNGPRRGWIYLVYAEKNPATPDVFLIRSTDGGATWSSPCRVNQDSSGQDQWFPWIAVDPLTSHLYVVYYDSRNFPANDSAQVFISSSADGGETFEDVLVSDAAFLPTPIPGLAAGYMGDYIGISALNGVVWPAWNDNRTGLYQAYTSRILFVEIGSPPKISVSPDPLDFEEAFLDYPETLSINIRNLGFPETLLVNNIVSDNPNFVPEVAHLAVPGAGAGKVKIVLIPSAPGPIAAKLFVTSNDTANPSVAIELRAHAVHPPFAHVFPDSLAFSLNVGENASAFFSIADTGLGTLSWRIFARESPPAASRLYLLPEADINLTTDIDPRIELDNEAPALQGKTPVLPLETLLADLSGLSIGITDPHNAYAVLRADLEARGAGVTNVHFPLAPGGLDSLDILAVDDEIAQASVDNITALRNWLSAGGGLFLQGDEALVNINKILAGTGLVEHGTGFFSDRLTNLLPHFITPGVETLNAQSSGAYFSTAAPARAIVLDNFSRPHAAVSSLGAGRVLAVGNEVGEDGNIGGGDTRLFCNRAFDWLFGFGNFLSFLPDSGSTAPGDSAVVELEVKTGQLEGGTYRADIVIYSNDPAHPENIIPVRLQVVGSPDIAFSPDTLYFGEGFIGFQDTLGLQISNTGTDLLEVSAISSDNPRFTVLDPENFSLFPGQFRAVRVQFLPGAAGAESGTLTVASSDPGSPTVFIHLVGHGIQPPVLEVNPDSLEFTLFEKDSAETVLTVTNAGFGPLDFKAVRRAVSLLPVDSSLRILTLDLLFKPHRLLDSLRFPDSLIFPFDFEGVDLRDFDLLFFGTPTTDVEVQVLINRKEDIETFLRAGGGVVALYEGTANAWQWLPVELIQIRNLCRELVHIIEPTHPAMDSLSDAGLSNWNCSYQGVFTRFDPFLRPLAAGMESENQSVVLAGEVGAGRLYLAATSNDLNIDEPGAVKMAGKAIQWAAGQASWLSVAPGGGTLSSGGSAELRIKVKTERLTGGSHRANILLPSNDPANPLDTIPVRLTVVPSPILALSTDTLVFGEAFVNYADTLILSIFNQGSVPLEVSGMNIDNPRFSLIDFAPFALPPGDTQKVRVEFRPVQIGLESGALTIASNDPNDPAVYVPLVGNVIQPPQMTVSPPSFTFTLNAGDSATGRITVDNAGPGTLSFSVINRLVKPASLFNPLSATPSLPAAPFDTAGVFGAEHLTVADDTVRVFVLRSYGTDYPGPIQTWNYLNGNFSLFGSRPIRINYTTLDITPITYAALAASQADVLLISDAWDSTSSYYGTFSLDEIGAIRQYVDGGRGLIVTAGTLNTLHQPSHNRLTPLLGLDSTKLYSGGDENKYSFENFNLTVHPVFDGFPDFYVPGERRSAIVLGGWQAALKGGERIADSYPSNQATIVVFLNRLYVSNRPEVSPNSEDYRFLYNAMVWAGAGAFWLSESPLAGSVPPGGRAEIEVKARTSQLEGGAYRANILVSGNDPANPQDTIPVRLNVNCGFARGDLDGNGLLTPADAVLELNCVFLGNGSGTALGDCNVCYTDVNCDGILNAVDMVLELLAVFLNRPLGC